MKFLWCNGQWMDPLDFLVAPSDRGLMLGLGLFETVLAVNGVPVLADLHVARLLDGCKRLGWQMEALDFNGIIRELIFMNDLKEGRARIRISITAGSGFIHDPSLGADHLVWMTAAACAEPPETTSVNLSRWLRNEKSALAGLKCASYAENLVALGEATKLGFEETLFFNHAGHLCEAATSNVFLVKNGEVSTPSLASGCLPGVTRMMVMELATAAGIPSCEKDLTPEDLAACDELFLTSSIRGVMGVSRYEQRIFEASPITSRLREAWKQII